MTIVYNLWYRHGDRIGGAHALVPGTYSTEAKAREMLVFLSDKSGFVDHGIEGFSIEPRTVDVTALPSGQVGSEGNLSGDTFYELWHHRKDERGYDHDTLIGIYSGEARAKLALAMVRNLPEFSDLPAGFEIVERPLDKTEWLEGFITIYPGEG